MPIYNFKKGTISFLPGEVIDYALYGLYVQENYVRMEEDGWVPLSPAEFFEPAEEYTNYRDQRMWSTAILQHIYTTVDGYTCSVGLPTIIVGPAETREQAECLLMLHEDIAYLPGRISFTLTRVSELLPAPLSRPPDDDDTAFRDQATTMWRVK